MLVNTFSKLIVSWAIVLWVAALYPMATGAAVNDDCLLGDVNLDGVVNLADVQDFCDLLVAGGCQCEANINNESIVDLLDVVPFRDVLLAQQSTDFQANTVTGAGDFFWSQKCLGEGAVNGNPYLNVEVGDSVTLYLYYTASGPSHSDIDQGVAINVATSKEGVIEFAAAGSFNFDIRVQETNVLRRWFYPVNDFQLAHQIQDNLIVGMTALNICQGEGLLTANTNEDESPFLDSGFDPSANAFLFGRLEFNALSHGMINLVAGVNNLGVAHDGVLQDPLFSSATIFVGNGILGDVNLDGDVNLVDVEFFIERLANGGYQNEADCNEDGTINLFDVAPFVDLLAGS